MAFLVLALLWLRAHGVTNPITFQQPLGAQLKRYPLGRKGYNGRVERSHRADDEEFYRPYLLSMQNENDTLALAARWVSFYNVQRPHLGEGMDKQTLLEVLQRLGYNGPDQIALFPPTLLGTISTDLILACDSQAGNDLLTHYKQEVSHEPITSRFSYPYWLDNIAAATLPSKSKATCIHRTGSFVSLRQALSL